MKKRRKYQRPLGHSRWLPIIRPDTKNVTAASIKKVFEQMLQKLIIFGEVAVHITGQEAP